METFTKDLFETVRTRIVIGDERQVMGVLGETRRVGLVETME